MLPTIAAIMIVSLICAALAALLVVADRVIADYPECAITVNDRKKIALKGGKSLLEALMAEKIFIPSACGGRGTCGYCKVKILEGGGPVLPTEEPFLSADEKADKVRLSCQVKVRNDMAISIPEELLAVQEYECVCSRIRDLTSTIREFRFELKKPRKIEYVPGQYVQLLAPAYEGSPEEVYRAYSISSDPADGGHVELVIKLVPGGICTTYCFEHLKEGDGARMNGPYGEFRLSDTDSKAVFIAGGSGMAPIKCMLHHLLSVGSRRSAVYFFGANRVNELFYPDEMRRFETALHDFKFVPVVADPSDEKWDGDTGLVTEAIDRGIRDVSDREGYLCGNPAMIEAAVAVLKKHGMKEENIFYDSFA